MKVLIVNPIMYTNETNNIRKVKSLKDTLMYNVCLGFLKRGDIPTLIASADYKPTEKEKYPFKIIFFKTRFRKICYPRAIPWLVGFRKFCKENKNKYDYVICSESFSLTTLIAVHIFKEKCLVWQEMAKHQKAFHHLPSKIWHNTVVRFFYGKVLIVPRSKEAQTFISKYSHNVSNQIIEHGINIDVFKNVPRANAKQFIVVSQLIERKQIDKILYAFSDFLTKYDDNYILKICGDGVLREKLINLAKKLEIQNNVIFMGNLTHQPLTYEYANSKALLVYTKQDNNMVSILESIASGTPILTTSVPYNSRYISAKKLGIVKDNWNATDLASMIENYNMFSNNCKKYRDKLSSSHSAIEFEKLTKSTGLLG